MWVRISLKYRIYLLLSAIFLVTVSGTTVMIWYSHSIEGVLNTITDENLAAFKNADALEVSLVNQKGFVSYYILDRDPNWLTQLEQYRLVFEENLDQAQALIQSTGQRQTIARIADEFDRYVREKDQVIHHYGTGEPQIGQRLHQEVRHRFSTILGMCEAYKGEHMQAILAVKQRALNEAGQLRDTAMTVIVTHLLLLLLLAYLLVHQVLNPVRALVLETRRSDTAQACGNDVQTLKQSVRGLIKDAGEAQVELEKSRENLAQAEKMVMVGKLAAGMAHSVRNPFTSVKMRLFSLSRSLELSGTQKEDFEVISEEIDHIDTIVQNFLEFSRPPRLKIQPVSPSSVVNTALQLLCYRLESYHVTVAIHRSRLLPTIDADPDQLKEVLVNLIINACEAMTGGGTIDIHELLSDGPQGAPRVEIRITDSGPGISPAVADKVFDPFFTTKEEGSGLGLSIATRIIREHGGHIHFSSLEGRGASFCILLPIRGGHR
ncbi:MAG: ATP-binding protein [Desulfosarcina sp.]